jgi:ABC-type Zn uptake system ZnuABC Zn-binding protein ZnuA
MQWCVLEFDSVLENIMKITIFVAATAALAFTSVAQASDTDNTYFWLHPKLGMVRVDKTTNAMVTTVPPQARETRTTLWIDPKGNVRRIPEFVPKPKP